MKSKLFQVLDRIALKFGVSRAELITSIVCLCAGSIYLAYTMCLLFIFCPHV